MSRWLGSRLPAACGLSLLILVCFATGVTEAERSGRGGLVASLDGRISPRSLPRHRPVPVTLTLSGAIHGSERPSPRLGAIELAFGSRGVVSTAGLPVCPRARLRNATRRQALARCGEAQVGHGTIVTELPTPAGEPLLARATALAFNGRTNGDQAVWVHAYSASPPASLLLPFRLRRVDAGGFGLLLRAPVAATLGPQPRLRSFELTLGRRYRYGGRSRSYLSASCPLPSLLDVGYFPLARATYRFTPAPALTVTILRGCSVRD